MKKKIFRYMLLLALLFGMYRCFIHTDTSARISFYDSNEKAGYFLSNIINDSTDYFLITTSGDYLYKDNIDSVANYYGCTNWLQEEIMNNDSVEAKVTLIYKGLKGEEGIWSPLTKPIYGNISGHKNCFKSTDSYLYFFIIKDEEDFINRTLYKVDKKSGEIIHLFIETGLSSIYKHDIYPVNDSVLWMTNETSGGFLVSNDAGETWVERDMPTYNFQDGQLDGELLYYTHTNDLGTCKIYCLNTKSMLIDSVQVDFEVSDFAVINKDEYWLIGIRSNKRLLYHYKDNNVKNIVLSELDSLYVPIYLYAYDNFVAFDAAQFPDYKPFRLTLPTALCFSHDNGKTWEIQENWPYGFTNLIFQKRSFYKDISMSVLTRPKAMMLIEF